MTFTQNYDPFGSAGLSPLAAAIPVVVRTCRSTVSLQNICTSWRTRLAASTCVVTHFLMLLPRSLKLPTLSEMLWKSPSGHAPTPRSRSPPGSDFFLERAGAGSV